MFSCTIKLLWADNIFFCRKYIIFIIGRQKGTELWKMCTDFLDFSFFFSFWNFGIPRLIIVTYWSLISDSARIVFTPGNHWSGRFPPLDRNKALWGSWLVVGSKGSKFWFGGDTAYSDVFKQIGKKFGPIDLSAIPIGAYNPR